MEGVDVTALQPTYRELYELVGEEKLLRIFEFYHGMQLNLPSHLYSGALVAKRLSITESDDYQVLARRYGFSERWIRTKIRESSRKTSRKSDA